MERRSPESSGPSRDPLTRRLWLARLALAWERLWPALGPALGVVGIFLALALFDLLPLLPDWLHGLALIAFGAVFAWALLGSRGAWRLPDAAAGRRRLEIASGFGHRPLATLDDRLAGGHDDPMAIALWHAHRLRLLAYIKSIRVGVPVAGLARRDPLALRAALLIVLLIAGAAAGPDARSRLARAFMPGIANASVPTGVLDLWITPPAYTGLPPILPKVDAGASPEIVAPAGSVLLAQVSGGLGVPVLTIDQTASAFALLDGRSYRIQATIEQGSRLAVEQGRTRLGAWALKVVPDRPPTIEFATAPTRTRRAALRLEYLAADDYGLASVDAQIRRAEPVAGRDEAPIEVALTLPGARLKETKGASFHELSAHPWAGLKVIVQLRAGDGAGQTGVSEEFVMVLPERVFQHPVARAIVEQRRALVGDPTTRATVSRALGAIGAVPAQYFDDMVVYLALRMAAIRLLRDPSIAGIDSVVTLLWDTALRIEDGRLSLAEREMRSLQQRLQDALANNANDAEIERLIQELQQAIDRYLQALMEDAQRRPDAQRQPLDRNAQRLGRNDLQRLLDQARQLARTGARDAARDLLARLQEMLENLRAAQSEGQMGDQQGGAESQALMRGLQEMMQRQQGLLDRSFRRSQQGRPGQRGQQPQPGQGQGPGQGGEPGEEGEMGDGADQESLRRALGEFMRELGEMMGNIPGGFGRAERAMRDAIDALSRGQPGRALRPQMDALDQLRAGTRELAQQLAERFGDRGGEGEADEADSQGSQMRDPAGRPLNGLGGLDGRDVNIPGASDVQRSREILDELLRRAGERFRPRLERDYIDRLLRRF